MSVRAMETGRQLTLAEHIAAAHRLGSEELDALGRLAGQLHGNNLLPVVGAGASYDCGMRIAKEIASDMYDSYTDNREYEPHDARLDRDDLAAVAEAIRVRSDQVRVVSELGLPDPTVWRQAEDMGEHFCVYRVLARMAQEDFLSEAFGFNYDCGAEAGLGAEGFSCGEIVAGQHWRDRAKIVADGAVAVDPRTTRQLFTLFKANGCAARYRELAEQDEAAAADGIVVTRAQLDQWRSSSWSYAPFRDRAQDHILMLIGFSAQDSKFSGLLREVLENVYRQLAADGRPRVVAIDEARAATSIEGLVQSGLGGAGAANRAVTQVCTEDSTATAALLVLLAELLATGLGDALSEEGVTLPDTLDARLSTLTIGAPIMRRWSYLVEAPGERELIQRANLISQRGYVPLNDDRKSSARLIASRERMRARLGRGRPESSEEALADHGFLVDPGRGRAYMPVGIAPDELSMSCRPGPELERLKAVLRGRYPSNLECILVPGDGSGPRGVNLANGREVDIV